MRGSLVRLSCSIAPPMGKRVGSLLALLWLVSISPNPAAAQVSAAIALVGGSVLVDKAGDELSDTVNQAQAAALAVLDKANELGRQRLEQIDGILKKTVGDLIGQSEQSAIKVLSEATKQVKDLRDQTIADLKQVIWEAECAGKRTLVQDLGQALGGLGVLLKTHQIRLEPPFKVNAEPSFYDLCFWCKDPYTVNVMEPFDRTYVAVRDMMESFISPENITEDTATHSLVGTWEYMSTLALKTSCFYQGSSDVWNREYLNYRERARRWRNVVDITVNLH